MPKQPANLRRRPVTASAPASGTQLNTVDSFQNFQMKMGMGTDNPTTGGNYGFNPISRNRIMLEWMYRGSWVCGLAADLPADDMTRAGVEFTTEMPPDDSEAIERIATALGVMTHVADVVRWSRVYGGAIGVALIDGQDPSTPLRLDTVGPEGFKGILVLDRWQVEPSVTDLVQEYGPHLGLPCFYRVMTNAPALRGRTVHYTRVLFRLVGNPLPYNQAQAENWWGTSVYERLFDRLTAYDSASAGVAQLIYKIYLRTLKVKGLREVVAQGGKALDGLAAYVENMRRFQGIEGITVIDQDDEFDVQTHSALSGLDTALLQMGQQMSGALQIPLVRLFGQSPAGLNSTGESDIRTYYDNIAAQQQRHLFEGVQRTYKLIARSMGIELPPGFGLKFRDLWQLDAAEKASTAKSVVDAVSAAKEQGFISDKIAMKELRQASRVTGIFTNITDADIDAADDSIGPPPDAGGLLGGPLLPTAPTIPGLPGAPNGQEDTTQAAPQPAIANQAPALPVAPPAQGRKRLQGFAAPGS